MKNKIEIQQVRAFVRDLIKKHVGNQAVEIHETFVIRDGFFCGRRFSCDSVSAFWNFEQNHVEFRDQAGELIATKSLRDLPVEMSSDAA